MANPSTHLSILLHWHVYSHFVASKEKIYKIIVRGRKITQCCHKPSCYMSSYKSILVFVLQSCTMQLVKLVIKCIKYYLVVENLPRKGIEKWQYQYNNIGLYLSEKVLAKGVLTGTNYKVRYQCDKVCTEKRSGWLDQSTKYLILTLETDLSSNIQCWFLWP